MHQSDAQMLHDFLGQLVRARGVQKDPEADALIQRAVSQQPDAAYLLVQRSLLMEQALEAAQAKIAALENQLGGSQRRGGGFLDPHSWGQRSQLSSHAPQHYQHAHQASYQQGVPGFMQRGPGFLRGGGGGLLGTMAATAAGVAAGSFLFHGLDNLFHDHDQGGQHLLSDNDAGNAFSDQSGSALAEQAGLNSIGESLDGPAAGFLDSGEAGIEGNHGFFDGDGSDEGLFS